MTKEQAALNAILDLDDYFTRRDYSYEDAVHYVKYVVRAAAKGNYDRDLDCSIGEGNSE